MHPIGVHTIALKFVLKVKFVANTLNEAMCTRMTDTIRDVLESRHVNYVMSSCLNLS